MRQFYGYSPGLFRLFMLGMLLALASASMAHAQNLNHTTGETEPAPGYLATSTVDADTHVIRLGPAQSRIIDLPRPASAVIVAAPDALSALLDSPQRLVLIPRQISATSLPVLDSDGQPMLQSAVIISGRNSSSMRITRGCSALGNCLPSSVEYCAGDCVTLPLMATVPAAPSIGGTEPDVQ